MELTLRDLFSHITPSYHPPRPENAYLLTPYRLCSILSQPRTLALPSFLAFPYNNFPSTLTVRSTERRSNLE